MSPFLQSTEVPEFVSKFRVVFPWKSAVSRNFAHGILRNSAEVKMYSEKIHFRGIPEIYFHGHPTARGKRQLPFFAANGKRKWLTSVCLLQSKTENGSLFS
jgi:hypothetical protein